VERVAAAVSPFASSASVNLSPLTGRDHEISLLKDRWERAQEGMGQVVLLVGEPGLGKSRLVHTLKDHVLGQKVEGEADAPVIEWRWSPQDPDTRLDPAHPFYPPCPGLRARGAAAGPIRPAAQPRVEIRPRPARRRAALGRSPVASDPRPVPPALVDARAAAGRDIPAHAGMAPRARHPRAGALHR